MVGYNKVRLAIVHLVAQAALPTPNKMDLIDTISMLTCTQSPSWNESLGPRTSLAKSINGDTYSTVQDFATISSLKELNLSDCRFLQPKGSTGLIPGLAAKRLEMIKNCVV
jgi:hypothetical protein